VGRKGGRGGGEKYLPPHHFANPAQGLSISDCPHFGKQHFSVRGDSWGMAKSGPGQVRLVTHL
jgi:hypothetical protein